MNVSVYLKNLGCNHNTYLSEVLIILAFTK